MGEFSGGLEASEESASSPLTSPPISPDTDNQRERGWGRSLGSHSAKITKVDSQASKLHGRAPWWGWASLQPSAKPPQEPRCPLTPTRPGALTPHPSWDGIEKEGSWFPLLLPSLGS